MSLHSRVSVSVRSWLRLAVLTVGAILLIGLLPVGSSASIEDEEIPEDLDVPSTWNSVTFEGVVDPPGAVDPLDNAGPAYHLYNIYYSGPCAPGAPRSKYLGEFTLPRYHYNTSLGRVWHYQTVYVRSYKDSSYKYTEYKQRGFRTAYKYVICPSTGGYYYAYYGAKKVGRIIVYRQPCWSGGCGPGGYIYKSWKVGW